MMTPRHDSDGLGLFVAAAMERELSLLKKKLDESARVTFHTVGIGPELAYQRLRSLLKPAPASTVDRSGAVLLLGFAGAVDPSLKPGDLILSSRYHQTGSSPQGSSPDSPLAEADGGIDSLAQSNDPFLPNFPDFLEPDPWMLGQAVDAVQETALRFTSLPSLTVDRVIGSLEDKRAVFDRYSVATVNMEDFPAAAAALEAGVPFLSVRAVLDVVDQPLPRYLPSLSPALLSIQGSRTVLSTLVHPWRITTLLRLAVQVRRAQWALAQFALSFIPKMADLPGAADLESAPEVGNSGRSLPSHPMQCLRMPSSVAGSTPGLTE